MTKPRLGMPRTRLGFIGVLLALIWIKTIIAYYFNFKLAPENLIQTIIMLTNPIGISLAFLSIGLYVRRPKRAIAMLGFIYTLINILLIANVLYYREFTDFMTIATILGVSKVSQGLGATSLSSLRPSDLVFYWDFILAAIVLVGYAIRNFVAKQNGQTPRWPITSAQFKPSRDSKQALGITVTGILCFMITMAASELNRPQLLTRTFDRTYIVRYLGLAPFTVYDGLKTAQTSQVRSQASSRDMDDVLQYTRQHYAAPDPAYFGAAKGKNVIIVHLESFQQFLIGQKIAGQEVTPFLNRLVKDTHTLSFSNIFNQVGLGKTSDAENMLETSTYGLPGSSLFSTYGNDNTFQAAPAILAQTKGYDSAVLHAGGAEFWNRNSTYKSLGYNYFFTSDFFHHSADQDTEFGIKDKLMFAESAKYLERLQQPFYSKIITTSNHFPFSIDETDVNFPDAGTKDVTVNQYFKTAHYLDSALAEFFTYLKKSGLDKNSLVMIYGDHYGVSADRSDNLAELLGKSKSDWNAFDITQLQRIPLMFYSPNLKGEQLKTYGGEIDVLPTLLHLLGVNTRPYVQFGTDLLSPQHDQTVAFRNRDFITPDYTVIGNKTYLNANGQEIKPDLEMKTILDEDRKNVATALKLSDLVATQNLLRFYTPAGFTPVNSSRYDYKNSLYRLLKTEADQMIKNQSSSLYAMRHNQTSTSLYETDAPELTDDTSPITDYPEAVISQQERGHQAIVDAASISQRRRANAIK